uniref:Uncharacterized protein LOC108038319 n=1 Tax=Drosophila rhopaloa TaxID=1041015 RepID=A0A6P4EB72_DRORH
MNPKSTKSLALKAIGKLSSRSGSWVPAIMKYLKSIGHEWKDAKKTARVMQRVLKLAVTSDDVEMTYHLPAGKKRKADGAAETAPPIKKAAASVEASLQTSEPAATEAAESSAVGTSMKPRKSIGTSSQPKTSRTEAKVFGKLVGLGKKVTNLFTGLNLCLSASETSMPNFPEVQASSTPIPQSPTKEKRKRKSNYNLFVNPRFLLCFMYKC